MLPEHGQLCRAVNGATNQLVYLERATKPYLRERMRQIQAFGLDDSLVLTEPGRGLFLLNPISRFIWESLCAGLAVSEITATLAGAFGKNPQEIAFDIEQALQNWEEYVFRPVPSPIVTPAPLAAAVLDGPEQVFDFSLYGHCFRLMISDRTLRDEIEQRFGPFQVHKRADYAPDFIFKLALTEVGYTITNPEGMIAYSDYFAGAARVDLINAIIRICFPDRNWIACIHAAALAHGDRCVLLSAQSGGGKSTLAAAMVAAGSRLITDDLAYIDFEDGKISGLPLAIMLREGSWQVLQSAYPELYDLPVQVRDEQFVRFLGVKSDGHAIPATPSAIFFLNRQEGAKAEAKVISNAEALMHIDETASWIDESPHRLPTFLRWLQKMPKYQLTYWDVAGAIELISHVWNE